MGRTACREPQCLCKDDLYLFTYFNKKEWPASPLDKHLFVCLFVWIGRKEITSSFYWQTNWERSNNMGTVFVCLLFICVKTIRTWPFWGGVKRTDKRGQNLLLRPVYILQAHVYSDTCTHFCPVARRITMLTSHSSVISQSFHVWKVITRKWMFWNLNQTKL
jgi:hypothetical protein